MMAASARLPVPLMIVGLVFIRGFSFLPTAPARTRILTPWMATEDYSLYEDVTTSPVTPAPDTGSRVPCDYKPCLENQVPCAQLASATKCLCPGLTPQNEIPEAPDLRSVSWNGSEVVARWCAPNSHVTGYHVTIGGQERTKFGKERRSGGVGAVDDVSKVCLVAVNDAGESRESCKMYQHGGSGPSLRAGLIGGALGLLLLVSLLVVLWRRNRRRKQQASITMRGTEGERQ